MSDITQCLNSSQKKTLAKYKLANEVNRLFSLYKLYVGDACQPMAGGAQGLLMKISCDTKILPIQSSNKFSGNSSKSLICSSTAKSSEILRSGCVFNNLPNDVILEIFAILTVDDLLHACLVCSRWRQLAEQEILWRRLLQRDANRWRQIRYDRNPDAYRQVCPGLSSKQIYMKCRERFSHNYGNLLTGAKENPLTPLTSIFSMILPIVHKPRVLMFGPGLETKTSKIVRSMLTDRCMNEGARFKVTGLVPGGFSGLGSGISIRFEEREFNLVVLYSNVKAVRQHLSAEDRVLQNKLFSVRNSQQQLENRYRTSNLENDEREMPQRLDTRQLFEVTPAVQRLCKNSQAFIYVVDASQSSKEINYSQAELFAMTCELWSPLSAPLLVLACRRDCPPNNALSSMAVVNTLRLGRLKKKWLTQTAEVDSLDGVRSGIRWLLSEI